MNSTIKRISYSLTTILFFILLWQIASLYKNQEFLFPSIIHIFKTLIKGINFKNLSYVLITTLRVLMAVVISLILGMLINLLYLKKPHSYSFFSPIIVFMRTIPFILITLLIWIILGIKYQTISLYFISSFLLLPLSVEGLKSGIDHFPQVLVDDLKMQDISFFEKVFKIYLPLLFPNILLILLQSIGLGFKIIVMGEYLMQIKRGIGIVIYQAKANLEIDKLLAWSVVLVIIVGLIDYYLNVVNKKIITTTNY